MNSVFFIWSVDPVIFSAGPLVIRWYGLFFALSFITGYAIMTAIYKHEGKPVKDLDSLMIYMAAGTIVGARLGHCLIYDPAYYLSHPVRILKIWEGGLASHGGAAGIILALFLYSRKRNDQPFLWLLDRIALPAALGGAFIRVGNLFNSEIYGKPADIPWGIVFSRIDNLPRHPSQLYESLACLVLFFILVAIYVICKGKPGSGRLTGAFFTMIFTARLFLEFFKVPQAAYNTGTLLNVGQLISLPFIAAGIGLIFYSLKQSGTGPE